ncbi:hypothetical protein ACLKA6_002564 [Drosophila palustris]
MQNPYGRNSIKKKKRDEAIMTMIVKDMEPFRIVEREGFRKYSHTGDPGVPTLPEAELLIASLMLASWPDRLPCFLSPLLYKRVSRTSFQLQVSQRIRFNKDKSNDNTAEEHMNWCSPARFQALATAGWTNCQPAVLAGTGQAEPKKNVAAKWKLPLLSTLRELRRIECNYRGPDSGKKSEGKFAFSRQGYVHYDSLGDIHPLSIVSKFRLPFDFRQQRGQ